MNQQTKIITNGKKTYVCIRAFFVKVVCIIDQGLLYSIIEQIITTRVWFIWHITHKSNTKLSNISPRISLSHMQISSNYWHTSNQPITVTTSKMISLSKIYVDIHNKKIQAVVLEIFSIHCIDKTRNCTYMIVTNKQQQQDYLYLQYNYRPRHIVVKV
jgi:hypothetical protein